MAAIRIGALSLDCSDPRQLGEFWAGLLDGEVAFASDEIAVVRLEHFLITAMSVPNWIRPTWPDGSVPKQSHLDLHVEDLATARSLALRLGALEPAAQPAPD